MNCLIVDDELPARELLEDNIRQLPFLHLVGVARNATEALVALDQGNVELMFLDIQMPGLSGLDLLNSLRKPPLVIMITAFEEHALEGFELEVIDYLVKPVPFPRFARAVQKASDRHRMQKLVAQNIPAIDHVFVNANYSLVKVALDDILYIEGLKDYVRIHLSAGKEIVTRLSLKAVEDKLNPTRFMRVHKSYIVALDKIDAIQKTQLTISRREIPIGDGYRAAFQCYLDERNF